MNESFYQMYKSIRDMIADCEYLPLCEISREFIRSSKINCERYDRSSTDYWDRWIKERNQQGDSSEVNEDSSNSRHNRSTDGV